MSLPTLNIIIPTFDRSRLVSQTITLLKENIEYSGKIQFMVGVAGQDDTESLLSEVHPDAILLKPPVSNLGNNLNHLLYSAFKYSPIVMQMDDDHWLMEKLKVDDHVEKVIKDERVKWIRLMGVEGHGYTADLIEKYWVVKWDSSGPMCLYITSNRPHIKHVRFHENFGLYPENLKLGLTEEGFCHQCRDISVSLQDPPMVAVPLTYDDTIWHHVGDSWQMKGL